MTEPTVIAGQPPRRIGPGTRLNDLYEIDALVATGGMGEVYRGHAIETGDIVAIKTIKPEFAGSGPALALFRKEASALHNLYHEAIIRYYVFSIDKPLGLPYLAMEFVAGEALSDIAPRGPLPPEAIDTLRRRLASGLAAAHDLGIIHRDVSPDNVILPGGNPARAKIIDFGIARSSLGGATVIGDGFAGKYGYVSPEQLGLFGGEVTPRSDIYSLGLVLAEASLGGRLDMGSNPLDVIEKRRAVPDLSHVDARLRPLLEAMLQPDPSARIASMAEVAAWTSPPVAAARPPASGAAQPRGGSTPRATGASPRKRLPLAVAAGALVLAALGGGAYWALQPPAGETQIAANAPAAGLEERPAPPKPAEAAPSGGMDTSSPAVSPPAAPPAATPPVPAPASSRDGGAGPRTDAPRTPPARPTPQTATAPSIPPSPPDQDRPAAASPDPGASPSASSRPAAPAASADRPRPPSGDPGPVASADSAAPPVRATTLERVADFIRDYRAGDCLYLAPISVGTREAAIEAYGSDAPAVVSFDAAFTGTFGFDPKIQLRLVTGPQCGVVDALVRQGTQRRQKVPKLSVVRDRLRSGQELAGALDLPDDGQGALLLVDHEGTVHSLSQHVRRAGRKLSFAVRMQSSGPAKPQLIVGVSSSEPLAFLKLERGTQAGDLFRQLSDELVRPNSPVALAVHYVRLGE